MPVSPEGGEDSSVAGKAQLHHCLHRPCNADATARRLPPASASQTSAAVVFLLCRVANQPTKDNCPPELHCWWHEGRMTREKMWFLFMWTKEKRSISSNKNGHRRSERSPADRRLPLSLKVAGEQKRNGEEDRATKQCKNPNRKLILLFLNVEKNSSSPVN